MKFCGCLIWELLNCFIYIYVFYQILDVFGHYFFMFFFPAPHSFLSPSRSPVTWMLDILILHHRSLRLWFSLSFFFFPPLSYSHWISTGLSSSSLTFLSSSFCYCTQAANLFISVTVFFNSISKLKFGSFYLAFLSWDFLFFHLFPEYSPLFVTFLQYLL